MNTKHNMLVYNMKLMLGFYSVYCLLRSLFCQRNFTCIPQYQLVPRTNSCNVSTRDILHKSFIKDTTMLVIKGTTMLVIKGTTMLVIKGTIMLVIKGTIMLVIKGTIMLVIKGTTMLVITIMYSSKYITSLFNCK